MDPRAVPDQAISFHQTGKLADAERLYLQLITVIPKEAVVHLMLGVVRAQQGRNSAALELIRTALVLKPDMPEVLSNLGNVLKTQGRLAEALARYDQAL